MKIQYSKSKYTEIQNKNCLFADCSDFSIFNSFKNKFNNFYSKQNNPIVKNRVKC